MKICRGCQVEKPISEFHVCSRQRVQSRCKPCRSAWYKDYYTRNSDKYRDREIVLRYGITREQVNDLRSRQKGLCVICDTALAGGRHEHIDHCHDTGAVRGILCSECNTGIGKLGDDPAKLRKAADYLERAFDVREWWASVK